jgi:hypothetical protein
MMLAAGEVVANNPWAGVILVTALMGAAIWWALREILPFVWSELAALIAGFTYGLRWVDSYWGGEFCAFAGAMMFGALIRLYKAPSKWMAAVAGLGWSIVWLIRPFESIALLILSWSFLAFLALRNRKERKLWVRTLIVLFIVESGAGVLTAVHNRQVTGSFTKLPYVLSQQVDGVPQSMLWQRAVSPPRFRFPELKASYLWQLQEKQQPVLSRASSVAHTAWDFFVTPWYSIPLLLAVALYTDRRVRVSWALTAVAVVGGILSSFFFAHYIAAYACVLVFLIVRGSMLLSQWTFRNRAVGFWVLVFLVIGGILQKPMSMLPVHIVRASVTGPLLTRTQIAANLGALGGRHVVFVRYGPNHTFHDEWVYNAANIDSSRIVWCRWMGSQDAEVIHYYRDRKFWIVDVDGNKVAKGISPYSLVE